MPAGQPDRFDGARMDADLKRLVGVYIDLVSACAAIRTGGDYARRRTSTTIKIHSLATALAARSAQNLTYRVRRLSVSTQDAVDTLEDECIVVNESVG